MEILYINPIGWTNDIWQQLNIENNWSKIDYINFENIKTIKQLNKKINNDLKKVRNFAGTIIASSYGGAYLAYLYRIDDQILNDSSQIILIDCQNIKFERATIRKIKFKTKQQILKYYLGNNFSSQTIKNIIVKNFINKHKHYHHFLNNYSFNNYLKLVQNTKIENLYQMKRIIIYSSIEIKNQKYIAIAENEHLYMLFEPMKIVKKIKKLEREK